MLNSIYDDLAATVGYTATVKLRTWFAGGWLYVPRRADESHALARLIGMPALRALVREFADGEQHLWLPVGDEDRYVRDRNIAMRLAAGATPAQVAHEFRLTPRRVEQLRDEMTASGALALAASRKNLGTGGVSAGPPPPC